MGLDDDLCRIWLERVDSRYLYRGMSARDLKDPLDPNDNPFGGMSAKLQQALEVLQRVVDSGFQFALIEEHWGRRYEHSLGNIVAWTRNDLRDSRIDFTSNYQYAREYADNWQGSQLKQNFKYIAEHLPKHRAEPALKAAMTDDDWRLLAEINRWVCEESPDHKGVVLWIRRSSPVFDANSECLPLGSFEVFRRNVLAEIERRHLPATPHSAEAVLPSESQEFYFSFRVPLFLNGLEKVEEIGGTGRRSLGAPPKSGQTP